MVRLVGIPQLSASSRCSTSLSLRPPPTPSPSPSCRLYSLRNPVKGPAAGRALKHRNRLFNSSSRRIHSSSRRRGLEEKEEGRVTLLQERQGSEEVAGSSADEGEQRRRRATNEDGGGGGGDGKVAYLSASSTFEAPVREGDVPVEAYLKLPIEQYFISDPSSITKVSADEFLFQLPKLHFFNVWVAPKVKMTVQVQDKPKTIVNIKADECVVSGSKFVEKMRINERLKIKVKTSLEEVELPHTTDDKREEGGSSSNSSSGTGADGNNGSSNHQRKKAMRARTNLEVWCEIVKPFNLFPKAFLEKSCNAVLRTTLKTLLRAFMVELKDDYVLWSTDESYREERANRSL